MRLQFAYFATSHQVQNEASSFGQIQEADADGAVGVPLGCRNCGADIGWRQRGAAGGPQLLQEFGSGDGN